MIALEIADIKECMAHLLLRETFDHFEFISGTITTFNTFEIDGYLHKEFFDSDDLSAGLYADYSFWKYSRLLFFAYQRKTYPAEF